MRIEERLSLSKKAHPAFEVEKIEELKQHLISKGMDVIEDDNLPGAKTFYAFDPFGNRIEFLEYIKIKFPYSLTCARV